MVTVEKRETSLEKLITQLENGEDGVYNLIKEDKNMIFQPKVTITKKDLRDIPFLSQVKDAISIWEDKLKNAKGKDAFIIKKAIIELRKDQYVIKNAYLKPVVSTKISKTVPIIKLEDNLKINKNQECEYSGFSLLNRKICQEILNNYSKLKEESWGNFNSDLWYLLYDFEKICDKALKEKPIYYKILQYKIDGMKNYQIQQELKKEFNVDFNLEYISNVWCRKIPSLIAETAETEYLDYYFLEKEKGKYRRCSKCGKVKLAHKKYFSKNNVSKDGFYSICKECRTIKKKSEAIKNG